MSHVAGTSHSSRCAGLWASMATSTSDRRVPTSLVCRLHTTGVGRPAGHRFRPVRARAHRHRPPRTMHQPATSLPGPATTAVLRSTALRLSKSHDLSLLITVRGSMCMCVSGVCVCAAATTRDCQCHGHLLSPHTHTRGRAPAPRAASRVSRLEDVEILLIHLEAQQLKCEAAGFGAIRAYIVVARPTNCHHAAAAASAAQALQLHAG